MRNKQEILNDRRVLKVYKDVDNRECVQIKIGS